MAVKDQGPQRRLGIPLGSRHILHNILQHRRNVQPHLGRDLRCIQRRNADDILDLPFDPLRVSSRQIDFVQHRQDLQIVFQRQIGIGQGLGFDALSGIHHQNGSFTSGQRAGHLIVEVHMARGIDQVEGIGFPILGLVIEPHGPGFDGNAPLPLQIHVVQQLVFHLPVGNSVTGLHQPVGQRGFAMIDMGHNGKIANFTLFCHPRLLLTANPRWAPSKMGRPIGPNPSSRNSLSAGISNPQGSPGSSASWGWICHDRYGPQWKNCEFYFVLSFPFLFPGQK